MKKVLFVVPTYNERENIGDFLREIINFIEQGISGFEFTILNVDDNSPDGTGEFVAGMRLKECYQLVRTKKLGLGSAYIAGFNWGLDLGYDYFVEIDADGSHLLSDFASLLAASAPETLVIGTRWMSGGKVLNWPWYRKLISILGTKYASKALALPYRDLTSGYRIFARDVLEAIDFDSVVTKGYGFQIEMVMKSIDNGKKVIELPITFIERSKGRSKMSKSIVCEAFRKVTIWGLRRIFTK